MPSCPFSTHLHATKFLSLCPNIFVSKKHPLSAVSLFQALSRSAKGDIYLKGWGSLISAISIFTVSPCGSRTSEPFNILKPAQTFNSYSQSIDRKKTERRGNEFEHKGFCLEAWCSWSGIRIVSIYVNSRKLNSICPVPGVPSCCMLTMCGKVRRQFWLVRPEFKKQESLIVWKRGRGGLLTWHVFRDPPAPFCLDCSRLLPLVHIPPPPRGS